MDLRSWEAANNLVREWEATGKVVETRSVAPTIAQAVSDYLRDCQIRLKTPSVKKYRTLLEKYLLPFCAGRRIVSLARLDISVLREFRESWTFAPVTQAKNLEYLRGFFGFCVVSGWSVNNPAVSIKAPQFSQQPTLPLSEGELKKLLAATRRYRGDGDKIRALILLLRYSGLRISDAVSLKRADLVAGRVFLHQQKTGTPVFVPIPGAVEKALKALPVGGNYFFWSGNGALKSAIENERRKLVALAELAEVEDVHFHRLRDSFAVSLLLAGIPIDQVSVLLGHRSVKITERHYSPWVKARQDQLEAAVRRIWT